MKKTLPQLLCLVLKSFNSVVSYIVDKEVVHVLFCHVVFGLPKWLEPFDIVLLDVVALAVVCLQWMGLFAQGTVHRNNKLSLYLSTCKYLENPFNLFRRMSGVEITIPVERLLIKGVITFYLLNRVDTSGLMHM